MQAIVLAAGRSSRMYPFSDYPHKSLLTVCGRTVLEHTIASIQKTGIQDIIVVVHDEKKMRAFLGSGETLGVNITYVMMEEPTGAGDALLLCKKYIKGDFFLLNASRVDFAEFKEKMEGKFENSRAVLVGQHEPFLERYGAIQVAKGKVIDLVEKPKSYDSSWLRIVGVYLLSKDFVSHLEKTPKDHYSLENALASLTKKETVNVLEIDKDAASLKYAWDLLSMKTYLLKRQVPHVSKNAKVAKSAEIVGDVVIEEGAEIMEGAVIKGSCYIGKNTIVGNRSVVRNYTSIEEGAVVGALMEMKNTLLMKGATTHSGFIGDSVIGECSKIAAGFTVGNVRLDREFVCVTLFKERVNTHLPSLGVLMGSGCNVSIRVSTMPGVTIGSRAVIGPSTTVMKNIPGNITYYTLFRGVVEEKNKKLFKKQKNLPKLVLFDIDYTLFNTDVFKSSKLKDYVLYDEVVEVLEKLKKNVAIGIFSEGVIDFQKNKLLQTNTTAYFAEEHVHITTKKEEILEELLQNYKNHTVFLVDDKLPILFSAKQFMPNVFTIWVKRGIFAGNQKPIKGFLPDAEVADLHGIIPIIEKA